MERPFELEYKQDMVDLSKLYFGYIPISSQKILNDALDYSMQKRLINYPAQLEDDYKKTLRNTTVDKLVNYIMAKQPIMTSYGTLFAKHSDEPNPLADVVQSFLDLRSVYKNKMFEYPKGSTEYEYYNLMQSLEKINGNSMTYGARARKGQVKNAKKLLG